MLNTHKLMVSAILASVALCACAADNDNKSVAPIQSAKDLQAYLQATPNSPLDHLSPAAKQRFVGNLVFGENGLGSFQYSDLKDLSATEIQQILSLFGVEHTSSMITRENVPSNLQEVIEGDYQDYKCVDVGSCMQANGYICTSNC